MNKISELRNEFAKLHEEAGQFVEKAATSEVSEEDKKANETRYARMDAIKVALDADKKRAEYAFDAKTENVELPVKPQVEITVRDNFDAKKIDRKEFAKYANQWMRTGRLDTRFATITGSTDGGILMPADVAGPIVPAAMNTLRQALAICGLQPWTTPSTRDIKLPIFTATAGSTVDLSGDSSADTAEFENEPALDESIISQIQTYHSGNLWFENRELAAVDFDLFEATIPAMIYSKELAFESAAISAVASDAGITQVVTTSANNAYTYGNLVSLNRILPKRYQASKVIVLGKDGYTFAENLTTTTGSPILNALDPQNASLKYFNGTPVVYSEDLEGFGANNVIGFVFSWVGARLRDAGDGNILQRFMQTSDRQGQTGADLYGYHSFNYSPLAVAKLKCHS